MKPLTPTRTIDVLIGDEEKKERNRERVPNLATLDHLVAFYDPLGSYGGSSPKLLKLPNSLFTPTIIRQ